MGLPWLAVFLFLTLVLTVEGFSLFSFINGCNSITWYIRPERGPFVFVFILSRCFCHLNYTRLPIFPLFTQNSSILLDPSLPSRTGNMIAALCSRYGVPSWDSKPQNPPGSSPLEKLPSELLRKVLTFVTQPTTACNDRVSMPCKSYTHPSSCS